MSSSRSRAFYFVFNIFTAHIILLKRWADVKYQNDRVCGKWSLQLSLLFILWFLFEVYFEHARPLIMVVKRFIG